MHRGLGVWAFAVCLAWAAQAHAQNWASQSPARGLSNMGIVGYQTRDWGQCTGADQVSVQRAIGACGRIIGERVSRDITAAALYYRSGHYRRSGDTERADADVARAIELLRALIRAEPRNGVHLFNLIFLRYEARDFAGAAGDFESAAALRPGDVKLRLGQGMFTFFAGDYAGAVAAFDIAAGVDPPSAEAQSGRCEARAALNVELDVAEQACAEGLRMSGQSSAALFSHGYFLFMQGRIEEALAEFEAAGQRDPANPNAAYGYAVASLRLGRNEDRANALLASVLASVPEMETYAQAGLRP